MRASAIDTSGWCQVENSEKKKERKKEKRGRDRKEGRANSRGPQRSVGSGHLLAVSELGLEPSGVDRLRSLEGQAVNAVQGERRQNADGARHSEQNGVVL